MPSPVPDVITMAWEVVQAAIRNGADPLKALWIVTYESKWKPSAHNTAGENSVGLFQLRIDGGMGNTALAQGIPVIDARGKPITDWDQIRVQIDWVTKQMARGGYTPWTVYTGQNPRRIQWPSDRRTAAEKIAQEVPELRDIAMMFVDWVPQNIIPLPPIPPAPRIPPIPQPRLPGAGQVRGEGRSQERALVQPQVSQLPPGECTLKDVLYGLVCSLPPPIAWLPGCDRARMCVGLEACRLFFAIVGILIGIALIFGGIYDRNVAVTVVTERASQTLATSAEA
jgi:hypothetical protein